MSKLSIPTFGCLGLLFSVLGAYNAATAPQPFDVYVVSIGSSYYASPEGGSVRGMSTISGANKSAREIATRLVAGGARGGVLLTSGPKNLVTRDDILAAVEAIGDTIAADQAHDPLIVFYIASHGVSEGVGWNHFSVPGTFLYEGRLSDLNVEALESSTLSAALLADRLAKTGARYVLILDSCYDARPANFEVPILSEGAVESLKSVAEILRTMNEFRQHDPVVYSTLPGTMAMTVTDPLRPSATPVAPLARRLMLLLAGAALRGGVLTLDDIVTGLSSVTVDSVTPPAVTNAERDASWARHVADYRYQEASQTALRLKELVGTGLAGTICCRDTLGGQATAKMRVVGSVQFSGNSGEFITGGRVIRYHGEVRVSRPDEATVVIEFENDTGTWEVALSVPDGSTLSPGNYTNAVRYSFAEANQASMSVTGAGRSCNDLRGEFSFKGVQIGKSGELEKLDAEFSQHCEGTAQLLSGRIIIGQ